MHNLSHTAYIKNWQSLAESRFFGHILLLLAGALGYGLVEIFWRGHTHWSMLMAGAICVWAVDYLDRMAGGLPDLAKALLCGLIITTVELLFGMAFNFYADAGVWDYSALPFNFLGQICLYYTLIWVALSVILLRLVRWLRQGLV
ncbi:MAG: hypothetical protein IJE29_01410 [Firmicutes bacterium]|nr:hypothetical protein [Bacillota bacterium]